ncbi:hypothetical protein FJY69_02545 [candidate division WOR-3 bacterium]|nr:hypothetical protein [candidate division WOR-3 bacterium]
MSGKWLTVALVGSIALNLAVVGSYIFERNRPPMAPPPPDFACGRPELHGVVRRMRMRMEPAMDTLREELMATRRGLMELVRRPDPSSEAESLLARIGMLEQQLNRLAFEHARQLMESLPPEAQERLLERLETRCGPDGRPGPRHRGLRRWPRDPKPGRHGGI